MTCALAASRPCRARRSSSSSWSRQTVSSSRGAAASHASLASVLATHSAAILLKASSASLGVPAPTAVRRMRSRTACSSARFRRIASIPALNGGSRSLPWPLVSWFHRAAALGSSRRSGRGNEGNPSLKSATSGSGSLVPLPMLWGFLNSSLERS